MTTIEFTDRDMRILGTIRTHRVLTTPQIGELFFSGRHSRLAQRRLRMLEVSGVIEHFLPPHTDGRAPYHWVLADNGAQVLAALQGLTPQELGHRPAAQRALRLNSHLGHITGLAETYVCFFTSARATPGARLQRWWTEARCRATWGHHVRPDAYLRWLQGDVSVDAFIEYDTGSEPLARVVAKIDRYRALAEETEHRTPVLFVVTGPKRLTNICRSLATPDPWVPVHVATIDQLTHPGPARPIWRQAGDANCAVRALVDLV
ncbi:replication-relaxation family protein [Nocardiopsis sp. NPDC049922]|uniref:replication-relaxation family protein n=1 Tax=Nocardiopsis sp. NPDC049922 TaxID=3155157 RepID=UPI0033EED8E1